MLDETKKYDHKELTKKQELFFFHPLSPGSCFFLPHGARVCNNLLEFMQSQYSKRDYEEVWAPNMYNMQLWETSGHAANYKENMFVFEVEKQEFGLKPVNCAGCCLIFDHRVRSYREDETKRERPVMIYKAILGSVEHMSAILLEHYKGKWPFWHSPRRAIVCPVSDKSQPYALQVQDHISAAGFYVDVDTSDRTINKKVREAQLAQLAQYNYILVVGEKVVGTGQVAFQVRGNNDANLKSIEDLLYHFEDEVAVYLSHN